MATPQENAALSTDVANELLAMISKKAAVPPVTIGSGEVKALAEAYAIVRDAMPRPTGKAASA